jgi:hypothetical protein
MAVSSGKATWGELSTSLGLEDLHDVLEIVRVDAHNAKVLDAKRARENR